MSIETTVRNVISAALIAGLALFAQVGSVLAQDSNKPTSAPIYWHAKYLEESSGTPEKQDAELTLSSETLVIKSKVKVKGKHKDKINDVTVISVPLDKITQVNSLNERPVHAAMAGLKTAGTVEFAFLQMSPADSGATAIVYFVYGFIPTMGISAVVHTHDKYSVEVKWDENGMYSEATVELQPAQYTSFVNALQNATGKNWANLRKAEREVGHHPRKRISTRLSRPASVAGTSLLAGEYQIVCVEREGGQADLIFIEGKSLNPHRVRAIAPSEVTASDGLASGDPVTLEDEAYVTRITQVTIAGKQFHIKPEPGL